MQKLQKSKTKVGLKTNKRPILKKLTGIPRDALLKSNTLSNPTSPSSAMSRPERAISFEDLDSADLDLDPTEISKLTTSLKGQILGSLQTFKSVSQEFISQATEVKAGVDELHKNFSHVPLSIQNLILESNKSMDEMLRMRTFLGNSRDRPRDTLDIELSSVGREEILFETLKSLRSEVGAIKEIVKENELEVKNKELENTELRTIVDKLKESIRSTAVSKSSVTTACSCSVF